MPITDLPDVPDVSAHWYRLVVDAVAQWPAPLRDLAGTATEAVLLVLVACMLVVWWRARRGPSPAMAVALAAPLAAVAGVAVNEAVKSVKEVDRPCRLVPDVVTILPCPAPGDWSFPSNHAAVAAAAAVAICWAGYRGVAALGVVAALTTAVLRVVVGLHFPHDVLVGLVIGGVVAAVVTPLGARALTPLVTAARRRPAVEVLVGRG
jgi:undecaprenyl-diphosphatase